VSKGIASNLKVVVKQKRRKKG